MSVPREFPSLDSCQRRALWAYREVDLAPHPVAGLVLPVEDAQNSSQALGLENLDPILRVSEQGSCLRHRGGGR